ncbi:Bax inhibitor-1 family protein [Thiomonas sp. FB-Cd]|uniref:Bax inhibitor-1 family protein n=1 Tax=Thiomonas sp. FB-Cd TaxID=1158292 RepID=UPI0004DF4073|nr:Bax inhibitor-1 family protein [Thiomonas sp. FB-Cd]
MPRPPYLPEFPGSIAPTAINELVRKTYVLLAETMVVTAVAAMFGMNMAFPYQHPFILMLLAFGALFAILFAGAKHGPIALPLVFVFTGLMGLSLGPILEVTVQLPNGPLVVAESAIGTAAIFGGLSLYAWISKRDFSFMGGFLFVGLIIVILAGLANIFLQMPALQLTVASAALFIFSGYTLVDTSRLVRGGETNPIFITVSLYLDVLNIFLSLLQLLSFLQGRRR